MDVLEAFRNGLDCLSNGRPLEAFPIFTHYAPVLPQAAVAQVLCLRHGIGIQPPAPQRAWRLLQRLIDKDYAPALLVAALWLRDDSFLTHVHDDSLPSDDARSVVLLRRVLELDSSNRFALTALGRAMLCGRAGFEEGDVLDGVKLLLRAADQGCMEAVAYLGRWMVQHREEFERGVGKSARGGPEDHAICVAGMKLLREAGDANEPYAHSVLSDVLDPERSPTVLTCLTRDSKSQRLKLTDGHNARQAELGFPYGYVLLGEALSAGTGSEGVDFDKACEHYVSAWDFHIETAADLLGFHFEKGAEGKAVGRIDPVKAKQWYEKGYLKEEPHATCHLAECYDDGIGVERDQSEAERLLLQGKEFALKKIEKGGSVKSRDGLIMIDAGLQRIYLARIFLVGDPEKSGSYDAKLRKMIGSTETNRRKKDVSAALKKLTNSTRARRGSNDGSSKAGDTDPNTKLLEELEELVGEGSAEELKLTKLI